MGNNNKLKAESSNQKERMGNGETEELMTSEVCTRTFRISANLKAFDMSD